MTSPGSESGCSPQSPVRLPPEFSRVKHPKSHWRPNDWTTRLVTLALERAVFNPAFIGPLCAGVILGSTGCVNRESIETACAKDIGGSSWASDDPVHYFSRVNCYRRYAGMGKVKVQKDIQESVTNHTAYLTKHFDPTLAWSSIELSLEDPSLDGFTGVDDYDRISEHSYVNSTSHGAWVHASLEIPAERNAAGWASIVDEEMHHFVYRQKFLQPASWGVGLAVDSVWRYSFEVYRFPADSQVTRPVLYPVDGQVDVPTTSDNFWDIDGYDVPIGTHGFHITATVGSMQGGSWTDPNPYDLFATDTTLTDGNGNDIDFWLITPDNATPGAFLYSIAVVPKEPLEPSTQYTMTSHIEWLDGSKDIETTFTTADASG